MWIILVTPPKLINNEEEKLSLIKTFHTDPLIGGHCGQKRLYAKLRSHYYWKNMPKYISKFVKTCELCKLNKIKPHTREPMVITETPAKPFDMVQIDTIGPLAKSNDGNL